MSGSVTRREWLRRCAAVVAPSLAFFGAAAACRGASSEPGRPKPTRRTALGGAMDFNSVVTGDHSPNECSPVLPEDFDGVQINAPARVVAGADQFVICGTYQFSAEYEARYASLHDMLALVAVHAASHRPTAHNLWPPGKTPAPGKVHPLSEPDWVEDHRVEGYFNIDLLRLLPDIAEQAGDYFIYALSEDHVSNVVRVSYVRE